MAKKAAERNEIARLREIFAGLPPKKMALAEELIVECARLKVRKDQLWEDIQKNGEYAEFSQSRDTPPYDRERPASRTYTATTQRYAAVIKQLNEMLPEESAGQSRLEVLMLDD